MYRKSMAVDRLPRRAGDRKPRAANTEVMRAMPRSWIPVPTKVERRAGFGGGRKTSPWTWGAGVSVEIMQLCNYVFMYLVRNDDG